MVPLVSAIMNMIVRFTTSTTGPNTRHSSLLFKVFSLDALIYLLTVYTGDDRNKAKQGTGGEFGGDGIDVDNRTQFRQVDHADTAVLTQNFIDHHHFTSLKPAGLR